ncbi:MAG: response regulator transcription factor [Dermatophilaceae bacterium]
MDEPIDPDGQRIRVLIADDHALFRRGLRVMLELDGDIEVVDEAGDGVDAVAKAEEHVPDIVLMDVRMPRSTGIEACQLIRERVPATRIVMLTMSEEESDLFEAVRAGANGYVLKDVPGDEIAAGLRKVHSGDSLISPSMASKLLAEFALLRRREPADTGAPAPKLTDREVQVLGLVARGMANREIGRELFISENTVKNHVRNILEKLSLHSRMEAVMYAVGRNLIDPPVG